MSSLHTDVSKSPEERFYGAVCAPNVLVRTDGTVLLIRDLDTMVPQPPAYRAPEITRAKSTGDQQTDLFAVSVMLLEAIVGRAVTPEEVTSLQTIEPHVHAYYRQYASDPLLALARRGLTATPAQRWGSARTFADAIVHVGGQRVASKADLQQLVQATLARQGERTTPVHPAPDGLVLPKAPATPQLDGLTSGSREPSYAPDPWVDEQRAALGPWLGPDDDVDRASSAVSLEPDGFFMMAQTPVPGARRRAPWAAAAAVLALGAIAWGVSSLLGQSEEAPPMASKGDVQEPALAEPERVATAATPRVEKPAAAIPAAAQVAEDQTEPVKPAAAAKAPELSEKRAPARSKSESRTAPVPQAAAEGRQKKPSIPRSSSPSGSRGVSSRYDPEGI